MHTQSGPRKIQTFRYFWIMPMICTLPFLGAKQRQQMINVIRFLIKLERATEKKKHELAMTSKTRIVWLNYQLMITNLSILFCVLADTLAGSVRYAIHLCWVHYLQSAYYYMYLQQISNLGETQPKCSESLVLVFTLFVGKICAGLG